MEDSTQYPTFAVISDASIGDVHAMTEILKHYDRYISQCSLRVLQDECGNIYKAVDEELKGLH